VLCDCASTSRRSALSLHDALPIYAGLYISAYMWSILPFLCFIILRNFVSALEEPIWALVISVVGVLANFLFNYALIFGNFGVPRSEEHTSELQSRENLVCRLLLET